MNDSGRPRSRLEHFTSGGDVVAWSFQIDVIAHDGLIIHGMCIDITRSNALRLSGHINDLEVGLAVLDNAKDAIGTFHRLKLSKLSIPGKDVTLPKIGAVREVRISGPIEDKAYALAVIENAKSALRNHLAMRNSVLPTGELTIEKL